MLLDKADLERRLKSPRNILNLPQLQRQRCAIVSMPRNGRTKGATNIPSPIKIMAGVLAKTESAKDVADALDISKSSVYKASGTNAPAEVKAAVDNTTEKIRDLALDKLMGSLGIINDETLANVSAKDASSIARNLATVANQLSPRDAVASGATLIIYAPQQRQEKHFPVIDVAAG